MSIIAIIVAIFYAIGATMFTISAFLVSNILGFAVLGVVFMIPTVILYLEAAKGGVN